MLSTLLPPFMAHIEAPLPRWATITRPPAMSGATSRQALRDIFVGKAVEAVTPDALGMKLVRDRVVIGQRIVIAVKGRIETGDLRQCRKIVQQRSDRREVMRLVQRRQRSVSLQPRHHGVIDQNRPVHNPARHARRDARPRSD